MVVYHDATPPGSRVFDIIRKRLQGGNVVNNCRIVILTHRQADPDALCSAGALKQLIEDQFRGSGVSAEIIVPQGASTLGRQVSSALTIKYSEEIQNMEDLSADLLIVVDTGDPKLLEPYAEAFQNSRSSKILIDHHSSSLNEKTWSDVEDQIVDPACTSTCEIVVLGLPQFVITKKIADILLTGLMFDSQHLGIAKKSTLEAALILVSSGSEISVAKKILRHESDRSELLGKLKAAQRLRYEEFAGRIIASSEISSYHASVARMLVDIGADVGIAYGRSDGEARMSVRSSQSFFKETTIDLSAQIERLASHFGIIGGGHSTAASASGSIEPGPMLSYFVQNLKSILQKK